jgi:hypothetical protein
MTSESRSGRHKRQKEKSHVRNKSMNAEDSRSPEVQVAFTRPDGRWHITGAGGGQGVADRGTDNASASFKPKGGTKPGVGSWSPKKGLLHYSLGVFPRGSARPTRRLSECHSFQENPKNTLPTEGAEARKRHTENGGAGSMPLNMGSFQIWWCWTANRRPNMRPCSEA